MVSTHNLYVQHKLHCWLKLHMQLSICAVHTVKPIAGFRQECYKHNDQAFTKILTLLYMQSGVIFISSKAQILTSIFASPAFLMRGLLHVTKLSQVPRCWLKKRIDKIDVQIWNVTEIKLTLGQALSAQSLKEHPKKTGRRRGLGQQQQNSETG